MILRFIGRFVGSILIQIACLVCCVALARGASAGLAWAVPEQYQAAVFYLLAGVAFINAATGRDGE